MINYKNQNPIIIYIYNIYIYWVKKELYDEDLKWYKGSLHIIIENILKMLSVTSI